MYGMWELDHKEGWVLKNWYFWTVVLEKTLESPLDCEKIKQVNPEGNQPWIFIGRTDAEVEAPVLWPHDRKSQLIGKNPEAGKDWRQEKKGVTEDKMVGWHHRLNGHELEQILGDSEGEQSLASCSPWGRRVRHDWVNEQDTDSRFRQMVWVWSPCLLRRKGGEMGASESPFLMESPEACLPGSFVFYPLSLFPATLLV